MSMPEKMLRGLLSGLGVKPEDVISGLNFVLAETQQIKADREAYKAGVREFVPRVNAFMTATDARLSRIEALLLRMAPAEADAPEPRQLTLNGAHHDVEKTD